MLRSREIRFGNDSFREQITGQTHQQNNVTNCDVLGLGHQKRQLKCIYLCCIKSVGNGNNLQSGNRGSRAITI